MHGASSSGSAASVPMRLSRKRSQTTAARDIYVGDASGSDSEAAARSVLRSFGASGSDTRGDGQLAHAQPPKRRMHARKRPACADADSDSDTNARAVLKRGGGSTLALAEAAIQAAAPKLRRGPKLAPAPSAKVREQRERRLRVNCASTLALRASDGDLRKTQTQQMMSTTDGLLHFRSGGVSASKYCGISYNTVLRIAMAPTHCGAGVPASHRIAWSMGPTQVVINNSNNIIIL